MRWRLPSTGLTESEEIVSGPYASLRELSDGTLLKAEEKQDIKST